MNSHELTSAFKIGQFIEGEKQVFLNILLFLLLFLFCFLFFKEFGLLDRPLFF